MPVILLLCAMLFLSAPQTAPRTLIENDRVAVWNAPGFSTPQPLDTVIVSLSGSAVFLPKGEPLKVAGPLIVISLKDHPVAPIANTSGYPLAFPRPGSKKILENARVIVWDCTWTPGVATPCTSTIKMLWSCSWRMATCNRRLRTGRLS